MNNKIDQATYVSCHEATFVSNKTKSNADYNKSTTCSEQQTFIHFQARAKAF